MLKILMKTTDRGTLIGAHMEGKSESFLIPHHIPDEAKEPAERIEGFAQRIAKNAAEWNKDLTAAGMNAKLKTEALASLQKPFVRLIQIGVKADQEANRLDHEVMDLGEPSAIDAMIVRHALSLSFADRLVFIGNANNSQLAALLRAGPEIVVPESKDADLWENTVVSRYRTAALIDKFAMQSNFAGIASLNDPFAASKPDRVSAEKQANEFIQNAKLQRGRIENLKQLVQRIAVMVAVLCDVTPEHAFAVLQGKEAL